MHDLTGPQGVQGPPGAAGKVGYQEVVGLQAAVAPAALATIQVQCPVGTTVLGGSYTDNPIGSATQVSGGPSDVGVWQLRMGNPTDSQITVTPHAICTRP